MKLRTKFVLTFLAIVVLTLGLLSLYVHGILTSRVENEKTNAYQAYVSQLSTSLRLVTSEIELSLFNQYNASYLATHLLSEEMSYAKTAAIQSRLTNIPLNLTAVSSVLAVDSDRHSYFSTAILDDHKEQFDQFLQDDLSHSFTIWMTDDNKEIYLKKDVYRPFPFKYAGIIIAHINREQFLSSLSLDDDTDTMLALITSQGDPLILTGGFNQETLDAATAQEPLSYRPISKQIVLGNELFWLTMHPSANQSWYVMQLVPISTMLAMPLALSSAIWIGSTFILLVALIIMSIITHSLSRDTKNLLSSMETVSRGDFEVTIPIRSNDEIGQLARQFHIMQCELKKVTRSMVTQATAKQQAEYEMLELKYRSLQSQISPHFICNILSSVHALSLMNRTREISTLSIKASRYLRDNLTNADQKYTTLQDEIRFVKEYVDLYQEVYPNTVTLVCDVSDDIEDCRVPNMLLQPLVENALVHGYPIDDSERAFQICISAKVEGTELVVCVKDNGKGISQDVIEMIERAEADHEFNKRLKGFGLRGVRQRLRLLYRENQSLRISSKPSIVTTVVIRIPYQT